jgi:hypothetical protein
MHAGTQEVPENGEGHSGVAVGDSKDVGAVREGDSLVTRQT